VRATQDIQTKKSKVIYLPPNKNKIISLIKQIYGEESIIKLLFGICWFAILRDGMENKNEDRKGKKDKQSKKNMRVGRRS
jgi:hypothetical protein